MSLFPLWLSEVLMLSWITLQMKLYYLWQQPKGLFLFPAGGAVNFRQGVTVVEDLMTELCKSFSPLKKLRRGLLMHFVLSLLSHLAFVKHTQHHKMFDALQEPIIFRPEMFNPGRFFWHYLFISLKTQNCFRVSSKIRVRKHCEADENLYHAYHENRLVESLPFYGCLDWRTACSLWLIVSLTAASLWSIDLRPTPAAAGAPPSHASLLSHWSTHEWAPWSC